MTQTQPATEKFTPPVLMVETGSSHTKLAGYDEFTETLFTQFSNGQIGRYGGVPAAKWEEWEATFQDENVSTGAFFNKQIRNEYPYELLWKPEEKPPTLEFQDAPNEPKEFTREGLLAYFQQMADEKGFVTTTPDWLADVGMLIVHAAKSEGIAQGSLDGYDAGVAAQEPPPLKAA